MARRKVELGGPGVAFCDFADSRPVVSVYGKHRGGRSVFTGSVVRYFPAPDETPDETAKRVDELRRGGAVAVRVQPRETPKENVTDGRDVGEESTKQVPVREALAEACEKVRGIDVKELTNYVMSIADEVSL